MLFWAEQFFIINIKKSLAGTVQKAVGRGIGAVEKAFGDICGGGGGVGDGKVGGKGLDLVEVELHLIWNNVK